MDDDAVGRLLTVGMLRPRHDRRGALAALRAIGGEAAATVLFRHKVLRMAVTVLSEWAATGTSADRSAVGELLAAIGPRVDHLATRMASTDRVVRVINAEAAAHGFAWWRMKGDTWQHRYPADRPRDVGDLDVLVLEVDDAWRLAGALRRRGYEYMSGELPWFKRDVTTGRLYGQIRLVTADRRGISVDLHAGPYSVRHCGLMPLRHGPPDPPGAGIPLEDDICAVVANAAGDCFITVKTVNDLVLALDRDIDVPHVHQTLDGAVLLPFLATCLDVVAAVSDLDDLRRRRWAVLRPEVAAEPAPPLAQPDPQLRTEVTVRHAHAVAVRMFPANHAVASGIAAGARAAYGREHPLRLAAPRQSGDLPELNNWTCVRLVPTSLARERFGSVSDGTDGPGAAEPGPETDVAECLSGMIGVERTPAGVLIRAADDRFVPTVDFALDPDLVRRALAEPAAGHRRVGGWRAGDR